MQIDNRAMPSVMQELHTIEFNYADGEGMDFEPFAEFLSEDETRSWIRAWTGNATLSGSEFLVFGHDGTGGYAAFWCVRHNAIILEQPIVFLDSEGALGVLASNFADYLWLLANGFGPYEALSYPDSRRTPSHEFSLFAAKHAIANKSTVAKILTKAHKEFPTFEEDIRALCS